MHFQRPAGLNAPGEPASVPPCVTPTVLSSRPSRAGPCHEPHSRGVHTPLAPWKPVPPRAPTLGPRLAADRPSRPRPDAPVGSPLARSLALTLWVTGYKSNHVPLLVRAGSLPSPELRRRRHYPRYVRAPPSVLFRCQSMPPTPSLVPRGGSTANHCLALPRPRRNFSSQRLLPPCATGRTHRSTPTPTPASNQA
jgi:hypothetical protein